VVVRNAMIVAIAAVVTIVAANTLTLIASMPIHFVAATANNTAALIASVVGFWFSYISAIIAAATRAIALIAFVARILERFDVLQRAQQFQQCFRIWKFRLWW
jgi:hypothetical protein